jgi:FkbM family methyltransferase
MSEEKYDTNIRHGLDCHLEYGKAFNQVLDIGSCTNKYKEILSRSFKNYVSFDPNKYSDPTHLVALSKNESEVLYYQFEEKEWCGLSTLNPHLIPHWTKKHNREFLIKPTFIKTKSLDSYNLKPDFVKLDAEGEEENILLGAEKTIHECRPTFLLEESYDHDHSKLLIEKWGYKKIVFDNPNVNDPVYVYKEQSHDK